MERRQVGSSVCAENRAQLHTDILKENYEIIQEFLTPITGIFWRYEGNSISKLQIVIEKNRMEIMTYKQHLFFNIISIQI